jgi:hypothetical protein
VVVTVEGSGFQVLHFKLGFGHYLEKIAELCGLKNADDRFVEVEKNQFNIQFHCAVQEFNEDADCRRIDIGNVLAVYRHDLGALCQLLVPGFFRMVDAFNIKIPFDVENDDLAEVFA